MGFFDTPTKSVAATGAKSSGFFSSGVMPSMPQTPVVQPDQPSTLGKIGSAVGNFAKGIVEPVTTIVARPFQAAAELAGVPDKTVNDISAKVPFGLVAPTPQNYGDVKKDIGRGIQTVALGIGGETALDAAGAVIKPTLGKLAAEGAVGGGAFGFGGSLEQGNDVFSKETLKQTGIGAATGAVLNPAISRGASYIGKALGKSSELTTDSGIFKYVDKEGGITVDSAGKMPKEGFVVSPSKATETVIPSKDFSAKSIADFKKVHANELAQPDAHLGIWTDGENKVLDVSHVKSDVASALEIGKNADQKAIWDIKGNKAIDVPQPKAPSFFNPEPPAPTPAEVHAKYAASQGYEPYNTNIPTIDAGKPSPTNLPTIQANAPENPFPGKIPGLKYEPIAEPKVPAPEYHPFTGDQIKTDTNIPETPTRSVATSRRLPSIKGDTVTKEANDLNSKYVKAGFDAIPDSEKAKLKGINEQDQINKVTNYMTTQPDEFKQNIIDGRVPKDVHPQVAFNAVKNKAIAEGDYATIRDLAHSPIATQESLAGQTLRASQILNNNDAADPVKLIQQNDRAIAENFQKKTGTTVEAATAKEVKQAMAKAPKPTLKDFISNIPEC